MADPTMEEMVAAVADLGDLLDLRLCARHIADSCLAWLTLGEERNFVVNVFLEEPLSRRIPESWQAFALIANTLGCLGIFRIRQCSNIWNRRARDPSCKRPKKGGRSKTVRDIALAEQVQNVSATFGVPSYP